MLPFFVYGTLLPEQPNYALWEDAVERVTPATLADATLFSMGHFPMMVAAEGKAVRGALVEISADSYPAILPIIDRLEEFDPADPSNSLYRRLAVQVQTDDGRTVQAWTYFGRVEETQGCLAIGEDWERFSAANRHSIASWWQRWREKPVPLFEMNKQ